MRSRQASSGKRQNFRSLQALLVAAICVPALLFAGNAWYTYRAAFREARAMLARVVDVAGEQAVRVLETDEMALDRIADRVATVDWDTIARSEDIHAFLVRIKNSLPHAGVVALIRPDSSIASADFAFPVPPIFVRPRSYLTIHRPGDADIYISDISRGTTSHKLNFGLTRAKPNSPHTPGSGVIFISVRPDYLAQYYDRIAGAQGVHINLVRADGVILARNPAPFAPLKLDDKSRFMQMVRLSPDHGRYETRSEIDGYDRIFAYKRLPGYPVYIAAGIDRQAVLQAWRHTMLTQLAFAIPVTLCLILATVIALRHTRREHEALAQARLEAERRAEVEERYRQAQKLEAVGQLTGGVAHDFNNILTVIAGNLELLERHVTSAAGRRLIASIERGAARGARLTHSLLAFARRQSLRPETVNPNRLIKEFGDLLRRAAGEAIDIQLALSPTLDPCRIDAAQFQSALLNLVVNARDAMPPSGGKIAIETQNLRIDEHTLSPSMDLPPGRYIIVSVTDTGQGMAREVIDRAFEPFFTTKEFGKGSGLGLSQVYGFVKQSGGHVQIESELGVGTTVRLYLPYSTDRPVGEDALGDAPAAVSRAAATILIVEDDAEVRDVVAAELTNLGYLVLTANDGPEALAMLQQPIPIDLVFTDMVMPNGIRGDELGRQAQLLRRNIKVLLTSGYPAAITPQTQTAERFTLLAKPYRPEDLARAIRACLRE